MLPKLDLIVNDISHISKDVKGKKFAQLQRNYGLLMVKKSKSDLSSNEDLDEEEKYLYEWNEEWIQKKYRVPIFREKIETLIKEGEKQKSLNKKKQIRDKIDNLLLKPKHLIMDIKESFYELKNRSDIYKEFLDTDELSSINYCESKINDYIDILNDLITRSYNLFPD